MVWRRLYLLLFAISGAGAGPVFSPWPRDHCTSGRILFPSDQYHVPWPWSCSCHSFPSLHMVAPSAHKKHGPKTPSRLPHNHSANTASGLRQLHMVRQECHTIPNLGRKDIGRGLGGAALFHSELVKCEALGDSRLFSFTIFL